MLVYNIIYRQEQHYCLTVIMSLIEIHKGKKEKRLNHIVGYSPPVINCAESSLGQSYKHF